MTDSDAKITAQPRSVFGKKVAHLRKEGLIPAVVYGSEIDSTPIMLNAKEFVKLYREAGESTIIDLMIVGQKTPLKVLIKDIEADYVKRCVLHVSFYKVNMNVSITTLVPLVFIGTAPSEKDGAVILENFDEVEVKCLPKDLPDHLDVDISKLAAIGDSVTFAELVMPEGVELALDEEELARSIVTATAPVSEEEEAAKLAEGSSAIEEVEVTEQSVEVEGEDGVVAEKTPETTKD